MSQPRFKRGADFWLGVDYTPAPGGAPDLLGYTATSQLLDGNGVRHDLTATISLDGLSVELYAPAASTTQWAGGSASLDVKFTNGTVVLTDTFTFPVLVQITLK